MTFKESPVVEQLASLDVELDDLDWTSLNGIAIRYQHELSRVIKKDMDDQGLPQPIFVLSMAALAFFICHMPRVSVEDDDCDDLSALSRESLRCKPL
jgi:hypothetical protein